MPNTTIDTYLSVVMAQHNANVEYNKRIYLGLVNASSRKYRFTCGYDNTFNEINRNIISNEDIGGEIRIRYGEDGNRYLDYTSTEFSAASKKTIEFAKSMRSITQQMDQSEIISRVYPLGAIKDNNSDERLQLSGSKYIDNTALIAKYGIRAGTVIFDDITNEAALKFAGQQYVNQLKDKHVQYTISAIDIDDDAETYEPGYNYKIINPLIGVNDTLRCIGVTIDINDKTQNSLTFGDKIETLSSLTSAKMSKIQSQINGLGGSNGLIRKIVDNQTALLCGDMGGHAVWKRNADGEPTDLFFIDTTDISTATQALRINRAGIGFWDKIKGGSALAGPYTQAWTLDGTFNTDYIVGKIIQGLVFNNGNGTFSVDKDGNVIAKAIQILGGKIQIETDDKNYDVIKLNCGKWTLELSPLQVKITSDEMGGYSIFQAGGIWHYWNNEMKVHIDSNSGDIATYGGGELVFHLHTNSRSVNVYGEGDSNRAIFLDGNNRAITLYPSGSTNRSIFLDGKTGTVYAENFQKTT